MFCGRKSHGHYHDAISILVAASGFHNRRNGSSWERPGDIESPLKPDLQPIYGLACVLHLDLSMSRMLQAVSISALLLTFAPAAHAQISFDVRMGEPPPPPRSYRVPPQPGPDYEWVEGYWYPAANGQYRWHNGYWTHAPYPDAYWVAPYYQGHQYYPGHWEGARGDVHHDHGWDQSRQRDENWRYQDGRPQDTRGFDERGRQGGSNEGGRQRASGSSGSAGPMTREQAQAIVRSAYQSVLQREPDPGSAGWVDRVFNDHWSQQQLENELRNSAEYRQKHPGR
jgi:hypothetical protein